MRRWFLLPLIALASPAIAAPKTVMPLDRDWQVRIDPTDTTAAAAHKRGPGGSPRPSPDRSSRT